jgi:hypothetical protein
MIDFRKQKIFTAFTELYKTNEGMDKKNVPLGTGRPRQKT